ncbi:MAG: hypothetical protein ACO3EZ_07510 [Prochlorotrichaceae cyanobacterium]
MSPILQVLTFLTGILFAVSLSAGIYGFLWGARLGEEALVGVRQPDSSSSTIWRENTTKPGDPTASPVPFVAEADVIKRVKEKTSAPLAATPTPAPNASPQATPVPPSADGFPYSTQNQGVYLEVLSLQVQDDTVSLEVALRNEGTQSVRFLYSFLTVTDNRGQSLGSSIEGLPSELPAVSDTFNGQIRIPRVNVAELDSINLELTDYPDQQIKLKLEEIPVSAQN